MRCTNINGMLYLSIRDIVMHVCKKTWNDSRETWRKLIPNKSQFMNDIKYFQFRGRGNSEQPVITVDGAMKLIMILPGENAKRMRAAASDILSRYLTGDESLIEEIKWNRSIGTMAACERMASDAARHQSTVSMPRWVYSTKSDAFPGLIKIGCSVDLDARMRSANTFCAPAPHIVVAAVPTFNHKRDEKMAHTHFANVRKEGEFFAVCKEDVQKYFNEFIMPVYQAELVISINKL